MTSADPEPTPRRHLAVAVVAAGIILVVGVVVFVLTNIEAVVYVQARTIRSLEAFEYAGAVFGVTVPLALWRMVPLAIGAFVSFWLIAPLRPELRVGGAIARSFVAVFVALVLVVIVTLIRLVADNQSSLSPSAGNPVDPRLYLLIGGGLLHDAWMTLSTTFLLVVATGLGTWGWMRDKALRA
jgi:hypothetical protein